MRIGCLQPSAFAFGCSVQALDGFVGDWLRSSQAPVGFPVQHRVVETELGVDVGVQRGLAQPHPARHLVQGHCGQPRLGSNVPRRVKDLRSGAIVHEQGLSKAGNPRLRTLMVQMAWLWLRHQPQSALTLWFEERVRRNGGRLKKTTIVALARKLLVALWKYVTAGVVIEGAVMKRT